MSNAPSLNEDDIRQQVNDACKALHDLAAVVIEVALNGATSAKIVQDTSRSADSFRNRSEGMLDEARGVLFEALTGAMPSGFVSTTAFAKALTNRIADNDIAAGLRPASTLSTAMRRVDEAERADRRAVADARSRGESICAAIGLGLPLTFEGVR